jgi:hypothetical protein
LLFAKLDLKEKTRFEGKGKVRKTVVMIRASEAVRLVEEMEKIGEQLGGGYIADNKDKRRVDGGEN